MQATAQTQTDAQATATGTGSPQAPATPVTITTVGTDGQAQTLTVPRTEAEVEQLIQQRREISDQLSSAAARRTGLVEQLRNAPEGTARTGLEERIRVLDQRIVQLETDLSVTGRQLAAAPSELVTLAQQDVYQGGGDDFEEGFMAGGFVVLMAAIVFTYVRKWRRRRRGGKQAAIPRDESSQRLERLEQGMEAIAIEIERVSEGQRFVTRLLSETREPAAAGRGAPHAVLQGGDPAKS